VNDEINICTNYVLFFFVHLKEEKLVVVGGGVAGVYGAIHAKTIVPHLNVAIIVKGKPLSKVCDCILFVLTAYE
jgi:hypothetical protein